MLMERYPGSQALINSRNRVSCSSIRLVWQSLTLARSARASSDAGSLRIDIKATKETPDEVRERLKKARIALREIDHGYCYSPDLTSHSPEHFGH